MANQKVVDRLLDEESATSLSLEVFIGRTIRFQVETMYSQEQYDVRAALNRCVLNFPRMAGLSFLQNFCHGSQLTWSV